MGVGLVLNLGCMIGIMDCGMGCCMVCCMGMFMGVGVMFVGGNGVFLIVVGEGYVYFEFLELCGEFGLFMGICCGMV